MWTTFMILAFGLVLYASIYTDYQNLPEEEKKALKQKIEKFCEE